ncbi:unnamed protein product, partial [Polarella glacialis]
MPAPAPAVGGYPNLVGGGGSKALELLRASRDAAKAKRAEGVVTKGAIGPAGPPDGDFGACLRDLGKPCHPSGSAATLGSESSELREQLQDSQAREQALEQKLARAEAERHQLRQPSPTPSCPSTPAGEKEAAQQEKTRLTMEVLRVERLLEEEREMAEVQKKGLEERANRLDAERLELEAKLLDRAR